MMQCKSRQINRRTATAVRKPGKKKLSDSDATASIGALWKRLTLSVFFLQKQLPAAGSPLLSSSTLEGFSRHGSLDPLALVLEGSGTSLNTKLGQFWPNCGIPADGNWNIHISILIILIRSRADKRLAKTFPPRGVCPSVYQGSRKKKNTPESQIISRNDDQDQRSQ